MSAWAYWKLLQGQYYDAESGLHYNRYRYYNPDTERYLTPDPVKLAGGINGYRYVPNPTGWVDPLGLSCITGRCPEKNDQRATQKQDPITPGAIDPIRSSTYEQASNNALEWLLENDFRAEKPTLGKFGPRKGEPVGMQTADGKTGYRIEHDERNGAHINVWSGKKKGPHYLFDSSPKTVIRLTKRFEKK
nr:RHS repeat-associated core domain-containing protein [Pseudomonas sp. AF03-9]